MSKKKFTQIKIEGARTNNLKDVNLEFPINKISCVYGPSGSGKSSLVFGTLVDESKRRYLNSLPNDIKFLWNIPPSADVDRIEPILPVWALPQINPVVGSRPVVSDLLGITELLARHFSLVGSFSCSQCSGKIIKSDLLEHINKWGKDLDESAVLYFLVSKEAYRSISPEGYPVRSAKSKKSNIKDFSEDDEFWEVIRTRKKNLKKSLLKVFEFLGGRKEAILIRTDINKKFTSFRESSLQCENCGVVFHEEDFRVEKFNPLVASGACTECNGFGLTLEYDIKKVVKNETLTLDEGAIPLLTYKQFSHLLEDFKKDLKKKSINPNLIFSKMPQKKWKILEFGGDFFGGLQDIYSYLESKKYKRSVRILSRRLKTEKICNSCHATRLNRGKVNLNIADFSIFDAYSSEVEELKLKLLQNHSDFDLSYKKLIDSLDTATDLGLESISLNRKVKTLSSGEYQRLLLSKILVQDGNGMLFVFDEPSRGLSLPEQKIFFDKINNLKKQGNTIVFVDHSNFLKNSSDILIEVGPRAGEEGGEIVSIKVNKKKKISAKEINFDKKSTFKNYLEFINVTVLKRSFKKIKIPLEEITQVVGKSGTGKSLFFKHVLFSHIEELHTGMKPTDIKYSIGKYHATNIISKISYFDPELRSGNARSTVGTFLGFSEIVRKHYAGLAISKKIGYEAGHFSPNSELGKCLTCEGRGVLEIDMQFLENLTVKCEDCDGKKLKSNISDITDGRLTVNEAYNFPLQQVLEEYKLTPKFLKIFEYTKLLNLSHLSLSRTLKSLSGGERLRLQFLKNLNLRIKNELLIFDNLSIGLSGKELEGICSILVELKAHKNTVIIIDSNPYFSKIANNHINFNSL